MAEKSLRTAARLARAALVER